MRAAAATSDIDTAIAAEQGPTVADRIAAAGLRQLGLQLLLESPTNPRKHFDTKGVAELATDLTRHGVLEPILVRQAPEDSMSFEVVFGARRVRAAAIAGLDTVPARVADLSDVEVIELQLAENLQRADLHAMEEAEAYELLHREHKLSVKEIADRYAVGKSESYVRARMKLCAIKDKAARQAFLDGKLDASTALLIARVPTEKLQKEFAASVLKGRFAGDADGALPYRQALALYQGHFMLQLSEAPWSRSDADLVPEAGACSTCPKRTGAQPELFADLTKSADVCTDTACFAGKKKAYVARLVDQAKAAGRQVLKGEAIKEIAPMGLGAYRYYRGFVALGDHCPDDSKGRTYRELLTGSKKPAAVVSADMEPTLLVDEAEGKTVEVLPAKLVKKALRDAGHKFAQATPAPRSSSSSGSGSKADKAAKEKYENRQAAEERAAKLAAAEIVRQAEADKNSGKALELLVLGLDGGYGHYLGSALDERGVKKGPNAATRFKAAAYKEPQLRALALALLLESDMSVHSPVMQLAAVHYGLDLKKLQAHAAELIAKEETPRCRECGCTEDKPCDVTGEGCSWIEKPDKKTKLGLCSACKGKKAAAKKGRG